MNSAPESLQPVADFLPQKPLSDVNETSRPPPLTEPEKALLSFPPEPVPNASKTTSDTQPPDRENELKLSGILNAEPDAQPAASSINPDSTLDKQIVAENPTINGTSHTTVNENFSNSEVSPPVPVTSTSASSHPAEPLPVSSLLQPESPPKQEILAPSLPSETLPQLSPPVEQHPVSHLREAPEPIPPESESALQIKSEKHEQDLARDLELAQGLSSGGDAPIERSLAPASEAQNLQLAEDTKAAGIDMMDTTPDQPLASTAEIAAAVEPVPTTTISSVPAVDAPIADVAMPAEVPAAPAPTPALPSTEPSTLDQLMTDASPPVKVAREREEDQSDGEPAYKRTKTDDAHSEDRDFKVPELPTPTSAAPAVNGATHTPAEVDSSTAQMTSARIKHLNKAIQAAKKVQCSRFFRTPVDHVAMNIPTYPEIVKEPMDLSTLERKLKAGEYPTVTAFKHDADLMVENAVKFNGPEHLVVKEGRELQARLVDAISTLPDVDFEEPSRAEKKAQKVKVEPSRAIPARRQSTSATGPSPGPARSPSTTTANQTFALTPEGVPLIRRDSNVADGRPKRAIHPPKRRDDLPGGRPKKKKFEWQLKFCKEVLSELKKPKHYQYGQYFLYPVDPVALNIPSYHSIIKKPMDLQTVESKLNANQYEKAKDFEEDVRQIFKNCFKFNIKGDAVFGAGEQFQKVFDDKWATKDDWLDDHEPASGPITPATDSEEEEEPEEEDDSEAERDEKLQQLQKQIEMMSKQMGELAQAKKKKKPTPPVQTKKTKKSGGKKEGKSASVPGAKKEKKSKSKPEKERFVTYNEKQYISMGISSLPESKMSEALRIIQSNVPSLKNTHETEIELDIDELPNHVLLKLLAFVKKYVPQAPPEPEPEKNYGGSGTTSSGKPKKNKPMSKHEQEAQIEELKGRLGRYGEQASPDPVQSIEQGDSSDQSDSEESEEE